MYNLFLNNLKHATLLIEQKTNKNYSRTEDFLMLKF